MMLDRLNGRNPGTATLPPIKAFVLPVILLVPLMGLWMISNPPHAKDRLAALEAQAERVDEVSKSSGDVKAFPAGSVCAGQPDEAMRNRMTVALANTGMQVQAFDISDAGPAGEGGLQAYRLSFKGNGSYEDAMAALDVLNRNRPKVFVDSTALRNHVSDVELEIEGRVFCR